jgi:hypothetical protein
MPQKERKAERANAHQGPTVHLRLDPDCQEQPLVAPDRQGRAPSKSGREREGERARTERIELNRMENYNDILF